MCTRTILHALKLQQPTFCQITLLKIVVLSWFYSIRSNQLDIEYYHYYIFASFFFTDGVFIFNWQHWKISSLMLDLEKIANRTIQFQWYSNIANRVTFLVLGSNRKAYIFLWDPHKLLYSINKTFLSFFLYYILLVTFPPSIVKISTQTFLTSNFIIKTTQMLFNQYQWYCHRNSVLLQYFLHHVFRIL